MLSPTTRTNISPLSYPAGTNSQSGDPIPSSNNLCNWNPTDNYQTWEGTTLSCTFPTGVKVTTHIDAGAAGYSDFSWAGWVSNGYQDFNCYKDTGRTLYSVDYGEGVYYCNSIYWCNPVSSTSDGYGARRLRLTTLSNSVSSMLG